jgi:hypothetical protein
MNILTNRLRAENEILKRLLKDGFVLINYDSTDCDGCSTSSVYKFDNLQSIYDSIESSSEWADGPFSYSVPIELKDGSYELNTSYKGGSW